MGTFSSLRFRNFRFLLGGTILAQAGGWIQSVTVSWLVYDLTGSGTLLGTINLVSSIAALSMIPFAGLLIDRFSRRSLMLAIDAWLFAVTFTLGIVIYTGHSHVSYLFILAFMCGLTNTIDGTLRQVIVFDLVPRSHTPNAVALIQTGWSLMRSFGPAVGGYLVLWFGAGGNFLCQAGAYFLIAFTIFQIHFPPRKMDTVRTSAVNNIKEGLRYVAKQRVTRVFMIMGFIPTLLIVPLLTVIVAIFAKDVYKGHANTLGIMLAAIGVGGILGRHLHRLTGARRTPRLAATYRAFSAVFIHGSLRVLYCVLDRTDLPCFGRVL
jgi:MFS family permease